MRFLSTVWVIGLLTAVTAWAEVTPNHLFTDHAVLQRDMPIPVWGMAHQGEQVTVELAEQTATIIANEDGQWKLWLEPMPAGGPYTLTIKGSNSVTLQDVWMGDVWICSGQSNMERQLGLRAGQKPIVNWEQEVASANYPQIRQYFVKKFPSNRPLQEVDAQWTVCSPESAADFSAVGYFFARDVHKTIGVPIGLIFTSWGGTVAEAWTSAESLLTMPVFQESVREVQRLATHPDETDTFDQRLSDWYRAHDAGSAQGLPWAQKDFQATDWPIMNLPVNWEADALPNFDGVVWFHKVVDVPEHWAGKKAELNLGGIDDQDTTWVNAIEIGQTENWQISRNYSIPEGVLQAGRNVIAIRVLDTGGGGGVYGRPKQMSLKVPELGENAKIALAGPWSYQASLPLRKAPNVPRRPGTSPNVTTVLYNGMIAPFLPARIKGAIWYQGESNNGRPYQYRELFPLMIQDWRKQWKQGDFPFLFVQIAPYKDMTPEIREAQFLTLSKSPNTAMAVITDAGDPLDIHPAHKQPVGQRLALAACALAYGQDIEYSGPLYRDMAIQEKEIVLHFTHTGSGLVAKDGDLKGFVIAGEDKNFVPAQARIEGRTVVVGSDQVANPVAVRYGWSNVPDVNLFNKEGLPATPFRTDVD